MLSAGHSIEKDVKRDDRCAPRDQFVDKPGMNTARPDLRWRLANLSKTVLPVRCLGQDVEKIAGLFVDANDNNVFRRLPWSPHLEQPRKSVTLLKRCAQLCPIEDTAKYSDDKAQNGSSS
jgi:hypothetical protein